LSNLADRQTDKRTRANGFTSFVGGSNNNNNNNTNIINFNNINFRCGACM